MSLILDQPTLTLIIASFAAISGWVAFFYQIISGKPKIKGKILQVMRGNFPNPTKPKEQLAMFLLFLYLTNIRKNSIHLRDYILEVNYNDNYERLKMVHWPNTGPQPHFGSPQGEILIPNFNKGLIYKQIKPVEFGTPLYGYLMFAGDPKFYNAKIEQYRLTCIDVFDRKHIITTESKSFVDLFHLQELFEIKMPDTKIIV